MQQWVPEQVMVRVADLRANPANARTHPPEQIAKLAHSIRAFGFTVPVLVDGDNTLVAGHGRLEAALQAGIEEVPAIRLDHLDPVQLKAYALADNKLALGASWDEQILIQELQALIASDINPEELGWDSGELEHLLGDWKTDFDNFGSFDPNAEANQVTVTVRCAMADKPDIVSAIEQILVKYNNASVA